MTLQVRLVTGDMLYNSVTVRMAEMTQEAFLSPLLSYFIDGLAAIIPCPRENIFIFNIQVSEFGIIIVVIIEMIMSLMIVIMLVIVINIIIINIIISIIIIITIIIVFFFKYLWGCYVYWGLIL